MAVKGFKLFTKRPTLTARKNRVGEFWLGQASPCCAVAADGEGIEHEVVPTEWTKTRRGGVWFIRRFLLPLPSDRTMDEIVINKPTLQQSRERLTVFLQQRKLRRTPERFALLERVMSQTSHFSIEDFHSRLEAEGSFHVSKATVYNTMQIFLEAGIVRRHSFNGRAQYEPVEPGGRNHHHLVCTRCGKVREIDDKNLADVVSHKRYPGFEPSYFSLYVYGLCPHCRRRK